MRRCAVRPLDAAPNPAAPRAPHPRKASSAKGLGHHAHCLRAERRARRRSYVPQYPACTGLYAATEIDDIVPDELFNTVAEVLAWRAHRPERLALAAAGL